MVDPPQVARDQMRGNEHKFRLAVQMSTWIITCAKHNNKMKSTDDELSVFHQRHVSMKFVNGQ